MLLKYMIKWVNSIITIEQKDILRVAVMGCVVNGPGEGKYANIWISLPDYIENPACQIFDDVKQVVIVKAGAAPAEFKRRVEVYVKRHMLVSNSPFATAFCI